MSMEKRRYHVDPVNRHLVYFGLGPHGEYRYVAEFDSTIPDEPQNMDYMRAQAFCDMMNKRLHDEEAP